MNMVEKEQIKDLNYSALEEAKYKNQQFGTLFQNLVIFAFLN
jgi:hypothetical protein